MKTYYTDRSRQEQQDRCARARWHAYHDGGRGMVLARRPLPLAVGGAVHAGLAALLRDGQDYIDKHFGSSNRVWQIIEDIAVVVALKELGKARGGGLELDPGELDARAGGETLAGELAATAEAWGMPLDAETASQLCSPLAGQRAFDEWLWEEQSALVEGLVRAWARRRWQGLLRDYEVLEVEREGEWRLADVTCPHCTGSGLMASPLVAAQVECSRCGGVGTIGVIFQSRPDALLLRRVDSTLWLQSFKTAAGWDARKERDAGRDVQGLSEGVEVERRLGEWWQQVNAGESFQEVLRLNITSATYKYLCNLPAPPRILGIRYEYLLKGARREDRALTARCGFAAWSQASPLTRCYEAVSVPQPKKGPPLFSHGDRCWSWEWRGDDGAQHKLAWQNWEARPTWRGEGGVRAWIDKLDAAEEVVKADPTVGETRTVGWWSPAQALGTTAEHPLESLLPPVLEVFRQEDEVRDWLEQAEERERRVVAGLEAVVAAAGDEAKRRIALNVHFPQSRRACEWPTTCPYANSATRLGPCFGPVGLDLRATGRFVEREPHHEAERQALAKEVK